MLVETIEHDVRGAADTPARPRLTVRDIQHLVVVAIKSDVAELEDLPHQPGGIGLGLRGEIIIVPVTGEAQKCRQIACRHQFGWRRPEIWCGVVHERSCALSGGRTKASAATHMASMAAFP
jgi:hypothetical protein